MEQKTFWCASIIFLALNFNAVTSRAQSSSVQESNPSLAAQTSQWTNHDLGQERIGLKPEIGFIGYQDPVAGSSSRATAGIGADFNFAPAWSIREVHLAVQTGVFYSALGQPGGDFYGNNSNAGMGTNTDYLLTIPADLKVGLNFYNFLRISVHGGGNVIYRSNDMAINLGAGAGNGSSDWNIFPNAGLDWEMSLSRHVNLLLRPDWTFTTAGNFFIGTLGVDFAID